VSKSSADWRLAHEKAKVDASGNQKQIDYIDKWAVEAADLDNNPDTPDNIVLFNDITQGKIKAIDGYQLVPRERKELDKSFYKALPDREVRQQTDKKMKKLLKQYYRKNPTRTTIEDSS
jgi:hypothetical protein